LSRLPLTSNEEAPGSKDDNDEVIWGNTWLLLNWSIVTNWSVTLAEISVTYFRTELVYEAVDQDISIYHKYLKMIFDNDVQNKFLL
jgi:hypothetical protein